ncbi:MAG: serine/threonine-protein kinase [Planctomycetota bacterium]
MDTDDQRPPAHDKLLRQALGATEHPAPWTAPGLDTLAAVFPELLVEDLIGQGGMAAVYRAVQKKLERRVALKVLRPDLAKEPEFVARFLREARALAQLQHPHVLTVYDFGEREGLCYLLVEYVDGANLRELMAMGRLSPAEALRLVPQVCAGLQFAHEHGIVHRDVKPENVLVDRHGQVRLADFGLAKLAGGSDPSLTRSSMVFGTPHYMAPEQWRGSGTVDHRADIYSLGVLLYELLTGRLPVGTYEPPSRSAGVPAGLDRVVHRSLEQEPERRYQSAREVQREVEAQSTDAAAPEAAGRPVAAVADDAGFVRRGWALFVQAVLLLLVSGVGLAMFVAVQRRRFFAREIAEHEIAVRERTLAAMRQALAQGDAWTQAPPEAKTFTLVEALPAPAFAAIVGTWVLATLVLVALLLVRAGRYGRGRSRFLWSLVAACAWLPFLAGLGFGLFQLAGSGVRRDAIANVLAAGFTATAAGLLFAWLWRRSATLARGPEPARRWLLASSCLVALASAVGVATYAQAAPSGVTTTLVQGVLRGDRLLGASRATVLDSLGPPRAISASATGMTWTYRTPDAAEATLTLQGDHVAVAESRALVPEGRAGVGPYLGQQLRDVVARLGAPVETMHGRLVDRFTFAGGIEITVAHDVVIGVERGK